MQVFQNSLESRFGTDPVRGRPKRVQVGSGWFRLIQAGQVAYLVVRLDVEIDLLSCECADPGEHRILARYFAVVFELGSCDDALEMALYRS